jgi:aspartyl protease family protein
LPCTDDPPEAVAELGRRLFFAALIRRMRSIIVFAIAAFVAAALAPRYFDRISSHAAAPMATTAPAVQVVAAPKPYSGGRRTVEIQPNARGHFRVDGIVDGRHLTFLVDTGATLIALRKSDAAILGYHPTARDYTLQTRTANGVIRVARVTLGMVEVGGVMVRDVDASVSPDEALGENLLGVSFLSRLHRFEYREGRLVLEE